MKRNNPYIAGPPIVDEKHFFGRDDLIQKLMQGLRSPKRNTFLLYGPRRIGKTSLLKQLEYHLCDEGYTQIYFDLNGKSRLYLNELLYEIAQVMADACAFQPPRHENFDQEGRYFLQVFLPQIEKASLQSNIVLLFDEFDYVEKTKPGQAGGEFLPFLAKNKRRFQKIKMIFSLASDRNLLALKSKFDGSVSIPRLSKREMASLVRQSEADNTLLWHQHAIEQVWNLTHGHPYLTQMICNIAWSNARNTSNKNTPTVTSDDIGAICEVALPYMKDLFQRVWRGLHTREQAILSIIIKHGNGAFESQKLCELLRKNRIHIQTNEISAILKKLVTLDIIEVVDTEKKLFDITVPLFSKWVASLKTEKKAADIASGSEKQSQNVVSPNSLESAVNIASAMEQKDNWDAAIKIYEPLLEKYPENNELRAKLHHARNQERLANRYNKALNAISCGDYEDAQKLLAEVILRDPAYKEASRFLLLATTGIDAKEMKHKLDHDNKELAHAKSQIVRLQGEIDKAKHNAGEVLAKQKQVEKLRQTIAETEEKEYEKLRKLANAQEEINQLQMVSPAKKPQKRSPQKTHIQDALVTLDSLLETKEKTAEAPAAAKSGQDDNWKHDANEETLSDTLATLDEVLDEPKEAQADEKEAPLFRNRTKKENERPLPKEKRATTAGMLKAKGQKQAEAFTDTALINAGQVEKLPDQQQQSWESRQEDEPSFPVDQQPSDSIEMAPVDENGSANSLLGEQDDLLTEEGPPENIEIHFQSNRSRARSDFRKKILTKKNTLKEQRRKKVQAGWIAGTLNSIPVFIWVLWLWYAQPLEWGSGGKIFVLITSVPAWLAACRFGASDREKHITSFLALSPVVSYCFYAILAFETLRPGVPSLTNGNYELLIIAGLIYISVIAIIAGISGQVASVVSIGTIGGACAGAALFLNNGGAIEATIVLATITATMLIINKVDAGSAASAGVMAGIPAGFLLFAITFRLTAPTFSISIQAGLVSLVAHIAAAGVVYAVNAAATKLIKRPAL